MWVGGEGSGGEGEMKDVQAAPTHARSSRMNFSTLEILSEFRIINSVSKKMISLDFIAFRILSN